MPDTKPHYTQNDSERIVNIHPNPTNLSSFTDKEVWTMFRDGHEGAFNFIYKQYFKLLLDYGFLFTNDRDLIKDSIQDLFIELRNSGTSLSQTDNIKYYLYKCMRWKISYMIKKKNRFRLHADMSRYFQLQFTISHESILLNKQLDEEMKKKVVDCLSTLPKRQKEAVYYFYFEDFSYQQVADIMKLRNIKSARNLIYKAIALMKETIKA